MDFSFVIVNALPQIQPAESIFFWWQIITIITIGAAYCFDEKDNIYKFKWYDYFVLGFILCAFIGIYYALNSGLTLISGLLAVYALFYSTMSANYSSRKVVINSWAEKAVDHLRQYKDSDLAVKVARMQLVDKPNYFKVRDVLWYRSNKQELAEKKLDVIYNYETKKIVIQINHKPIITNEYSVNNPTEWIKIYAKLDIEQYTAQLIKTEFEVMAKNGVFAGTKVRKKWKDQEKKVDYEWQNEAKFQYLWLHCAQLVKARLQGVKFAGTELQCANLFEAQLQNACLCSTKLQGANLVKVQLQNACLFKTLLQGANIDEANLHGTIIPRYNPEINRFDKILLTTAILDESNYYKSFLPDFDGVKNIDSAIFSDDEETNKKVIAKIKQKYKLP